MDRPRYHDVKGTHLVRCRQHHAHEKMINPFQGPPRKNWSHDVGQRSKSGKEKQERYDNVLKVYVKNLPSDDLTTNSAVLKLLSSCGEILHSHFFSKTLAGQKIHQALVVFSTEEEAGQASQLTGSLIGERHLIVSKHHQFAQASSKMVLVSNISVETDEEDLWQFFEECGSIAYIHIDRPLNACSLRAEVHFKLDKGAKKALKYSGRALKGNDLNVARKEDEQNSKEFPVFIAGLPHDVQKEDLVNFFDGCGPIKRIKIKSKQDEDGHAIIFFMDSESAENALSCNGNDINGNVLSVTQREVGMLYHHLENPVYLAGLPRDTKDVDIFLHFQDCGLIKDIKFVQSKHGSLKKCYIEFKDPESISKALCMTDLELKGKKLAIGRSSEVWSGLHVEAATPISGKKRGKKHENESLLAKSPPEESMLEVKRRKSKMKVTQT